MNVRLQPPTVPGQNTPAQRQEVLQFAEDRAGQLRNRILAGARQAVAADDGPHDYSDKMAGVVRLANAEASFQSGADVRAGRRLRDGEAQGLDHYHYDDGLEIQRFERSGSREIYTLKKRFHFAPLDDRYSVGPIRTRGSGHIDWQQRLIMDPKAGTIEYSESNLIGETIGKKEWNEVYGHPATPGPEG